MKHNSTSYTVYLIINNFFINVVIYLFYSDFISKTLESDRDCDKVLPIHYQTSKD